MTGPEHRETDTDQGMIRSVVDAFFGAFVSGPGMKSIQLIRTVGGWRISAAAWDDERDGLTLPTASVRR